MGEGRKINIAQLYPRAMNIYGDNGNLQALRWRLLKRGFEPVISYVHQGESIPKRTDIIVSGGGQDSGQLKVQADLQTKAEDLRAMRDDGVVMLAVCGMYQLLGHYFETGEGQTIQGAGVINAATKAGSERLIGNIVLESEYGRLVGFENHSGETTLDSDVFPLGRVSKGHGNTKESMFEGAITKNVFGTYLHGPVLPKNPRLADELLTRAVDRRYGIAQLEHLDDTLAGYAATVHAERPR